MTDVNPDVLAQMLKDWLDQLAAADTENYDAAVPEVVNEEYLEDVSREDYRAAMEQVFDEYDVPEEMREQVYEQLDAHGDYSAGGYIQNLTLVLNDNDINNHIDNSLTVEHGAEVHGDISQANETNVANAGGEGSIAGRDQEGQFQTGDGVQVGDDNDGVVNQGDNSGQQAGDYAEADDITTGDGNFNNEGTIDDSAIAFGEGDAYNQADDVVDHSVNDSYDTEDSYNTEDSFNTQDSYNTDDTYTETVDVDAHVDTDVEHSYNSDDDHHDVDDSYNETGEDMAYE